MAGLDDLMAIADEERALFAANEERYTAAMVRADAAEVEVRALREALERIQIKAAVMQGRRRDVMADQLEHIVDIASRALAPEPAESG